MKARQDCLWYDAERASYLAGVEFADRFGVRRLTKQDESIVGRAIRAYEARVAAKQNNGLGSISLSTIAGLDVSEYADGPGYDSMCGFGT